MLNKCLFIASALFTTVALAETQTFTVDKMTCMSCVEKVEKKVCQPMMKAKKLNKCEVTVGSVVTEAEKINVDEIKKAIEKAGYPVSGVAAATTSTKTEETTTSEKPATN